MISPHCLGCQDPECRWCDAEPAQHYVDDVEPAEADLEHAAELAVIAYEAQLDARASQ